MTHSRIFCFINRLFIYWIKHGRKHTGFELEQDDRQRTAVCVFDGEEERQFASRRLSDKSCACTGVRVCVCVSFVQFCGEMQWKITGCKRAVENGVLNLKPRCGDVWCVDAKHQSPHSNIWCKCVSDWHGSIWTPDRWRHWSAAENLLRQTEVETETEGHTNRDDRDDTWKQHKNTHSTHGDSERCRSGGRSLHGGCRLVRGAAWHAASASCPLWRRLCGERFAKRENDP